jgi:hypothetical protein
MIEDFSTYTTISRYDAALATLHQNGTSVVVDVNAYTSLDTSLIEALNLAVTRGKPETFVVRSGQSYDALVNLLLKQHVPQETIDGLVSITGSNPELRIGKNSTVALHTPCTPLNASFLEKNTKEEALLSNVKAAIITELPHLIKDLEIKHRIASDFEVQGVEGAVAVNIHPDLNFSTENLAGKSLADLKDHAASVSTYLDGNKLDYHFYPIAAIESGIPSYSEDKEARQIEALNGITLTRTDNGCAIDYGSIADYIRKQDTTLCEKKIKAIQIFVQEKLKHALGTHYAEPSTATQSNQNVFYVQPSGDTVTMFQKPNPEHVLSEALQYFPAVDFIMSPVRGIDQNDIAEAITTRLNKPHHFEAPTHQLSNGHSTSNGRVSSSGMAASELSTSGRST